MDNRDGKIFMEDSERFRKMVADEEAARHLQTMKIAPTEKQMARKPPRVGRNEPCPCDSGKKFKKCCLFTGARP